MARGKKPKPAHLHLLAGTHRPDRHVHPDDVPQPEQAFDLRPPAYLDHLAREEWEAVVPQLVALGLLAKIDRQVFACYCIAVSSLIAAQKDIDEHGISIKTYDDEGRVIRAVKNPAMTVQDESMRQIRLIAAEFGLTPSARARVSIRQTPPVGAGGGKRGGRSKADAARRLLDKR